MNNNELISLLRLRIAVYKIGCEKGLWPCLEDKAAKDYMQYLFPKSPALAFYNLMVNIVRKKHKEYIPSEMYDLFNCPIQLEEELFYYLKTHSDESLWEFSSGPMQYIQSVATVSCDSSLNPVYIGQLSENIDNTVRVMAVHYNNMFTQNYNCYPYYN